MGHHIAIDRELGKFKLISSCDAHGGTFGSVDEHVVLVASSLMAKHGVLEHRISGQRGLAECCHCDMSHEFPAMAVLMWHNVDHGQADNRPHLGTLWHPKYNFTSIRGGIIDPDMQPAT